MEKRYVKIGNINVLKEPYVLPKDADFFSRVAALLIGKIKPENESDQRILDEAKEIEKRGHVVEIPFN